MATTPTGAAASAAITAAEQILPAVIAAAGAAASPQVAAITELAPIAVNLLQSAMQLQSAGAMTGDQLAALFATIGQGVQSTHDAWTALNEKGAAA